MSELVRSFDWSATPLGSPDEWSPALRTTVRILLANRFPQLLWWGPEYISIYNDAYRPILGRKHPWALGKAVRECWSEIWDILKPLIDTPFKGGPATWSDDIELQINRAGFTEETHFTVAYSPVPDETASGGIGGVLATVHEITEKVVSQRRITMLRDLGTRAARAQTFEEACGVLATLSAHTKDIPFALLYVTDDSGKQARLAASCGLDDSGEIGPPVIPLDKTGSADTVWPLAIAQSTEQMQLVTDLDAKFTGVPLGPWPDPPNSAVIVPIRSHVAHQFSGFLVAGLSSRLQFDESYRNFLDLASSQIATAIANAKAYEEEHKRAEKLAELDRAKTTFFSNISHEFRTPLTLMLGPLEALLSDTNELAPHQREQLVIAHRNSLRLLKLVNSLLDFSRIEAGRVRASFRPVDLAGFTRDIASSFRSAIENVGLEFIVDCAPLPRPVYVDCDMWEKIVLNFLSNAFKFTFQGRITVTLNATEDYAVLTVADTGTGLAESEIPHIFERFHRVEGAKGRTYEGTGIGLALIQELVKLHGGSVSVRSRFGEGSAFTVTIPFGSAHLPQDRIGPAPAQLSTGVLAEALEGEALSWASRQRLAHPSDDFSAHLDATTGAHPRVLLADDNADIRDYVSRILGEQYELIAVADGRTALEVARRSRPDLILTDVMMPQLDGYGLLAELRADEKLRDIPVIILSARAGEEARTEGISAGADDYLTKPFAVGELRARVKTTLDLRRIRREAEQRVRDSEERLRLAQEAAEVGAFDWNIQTGVNTWTPQLEKLYGLAPGEFSRTQQAWENLVHPEDRARAVDHVREALETGAPVHCEWRVIWPDGSLHWLAGRFQVSKDAAGNPVRLSGVNFDITARKEIESELRRSNADLEQFAYSASHDLQEPLRTVHIYSELLASRVGDKLEAEPRILLETITGGVARMEKLLHDLLEYARTARMEKATAPVSTSQAVDEVLVALSGAIGESGTRLSVDSLPPVRMNPTHLRQLFQNLVSNAIKYRRPGQTPLVQIGARREKEGVLFSVRDNGIGIDERYRGRIFGLFQRLHTDDRYSGTGLGLALCKRIVELYNGRIWVESEQGKGSTFYFTVPG
jgi:PAS domain S-box-containing protein